MSGLDDWREKGVLDGSPAPVFEILGEADAQILDASPFKARPTSPGRPKGAANKRTLEMRDLYLRSGFTHPMLWQGHMLTSKVEDLALALSCSKADAAELQRKIASDLLPYLESKMPTKVDVKDERLPVLVVGETLASIAQARSDGSLAIDDDLAEGLFPPQKNQSISPADGDGSHGDGSHDAGKLLEKPDNSPRPAAD